MKTKYISTILQHMQEKAGCEIIDVVDHQDIATVKLNISSFPPKSDYQISFFEADGAGTLGMKIRWTIGKVTNFSVVWKCLVLNENTFLNQGPLFAAIIPRGDDGIFSLVGQMIFSPNTPPEEIATLWLNQAFLNYALFGISAPGVEMF